MRSLLLLVSVILQLVSLSLESASGQKTFLIVNGAGFVGYHTAIRLADNHPAAAAAAAVAAVVVVDEFSKKKDNNIQKLRAQKLSKIHGVSVYQGDSCDRYFLTELFKHNQFQTVIYSPSDNKETDADMLTQHTECVATVLEILKKYKNIRFILLSSDIVYGDSTPPNSPVLSIKAPPTSLEAAMKLSSETIVSSYCELYNVPVVILRLFGVYGPWSDPGNVIRDVTEQVYHDMDVTLPLESSAQRDFTYIEDVVDGIVLALDRSTAKGCANVYNIGTGVSTTVQSVVDMIATSLNKKASMGDDSVSKPGEPRHIQAKLSSDLGYTPKVTLQEGIAKYTSWFVKNVADLDKSVSFVPDTTVESGALKNHLLYKSELYIDRIRDLRENYEVFAEEHGYPVSKLYRTKTFTKHTGVTLTGGNNQKTKDMNELLYRCQIFDECMAYDTSGNIKGVLDTTGTSYGAVYVADVDVCKAGVHKCYGNASCVSTGPGQFKCSCPPGWKLYRDHDCVELYKEGYRSTAEKIEQITDNIDGLNWNSFARSNDFYPFKGKMIKNEFLVYYPEAAGNIQLLKEACIKSYHCMGFTSDGILLSNVDVRKWEDDHRVTLYARDVDYCSLDEVLCRPGQHCRRVSPGKYSCT